MYIDLPAPRCSKCKSTRSESFTREDCSGIRCLDCGHEFKATTTSPGGDKSKWVRTETDNVF